MDGKLKFTQREKIVGLGTPLNTVRFVLFHTWKPNITGPLAKYSCTNYEVRGAVRTSSGKSVIENTSITLICFAQHSVDCIVKIIQNDNTTSLVEFL